MAGKEYFIFELEKFMIGISTDEIWKVVMVESFTPVPLLPEEIIGIGLYRNDIIVIKDLEKILGIKKGKSSFNPELDSIAVVDQRGFEQKDYLYGIPIKRYLTYLDIDKLELKTELPYDIKKGEFIEGYYFEKDIVFIIKQGKLKEIIKD